MKLETREYAFLLLYEAIIRHETIEDLDQLYAETEQMTEISVPERVKKLVHGAYEKQDQIMSILEKYSPRRKPNRISVVNRAILFLAFYELMLGTQPEGVIISEAIRLSHDYAYDEDTAFINGILGAYVRDCKKISTEGESNGANPRD